MNNTAHIFDFDGTLVDSMPCWSQKMIRILEQQGINYPPDIVETITPLGDAGTARYFRDVLGVSLSIAEMLEQMDRYAIPQYRDVIPLKPGVMQYLLKLKDNGCSLHILTASPHKMADTCLKRLQVYDLFAHVWSCDDFGTTKADPQIYLDAVSKIGVPTQKVVFYDDNTEAIRTAKRAGLYTVGVYDKTGSGFIDEMQKTADKYILSFSGLEPLMK